MIEKTNQTSNQSPTQNQTPNKPAAPGQKLTIPPKRTIPTVVQEPSISMNVEEVSIVLEGIELLPPERKKTVVYDRLMMKMNAVSEYWKKVSRIEKRAAEIEKNKTTIKPEAKPEIKTDKKVMR